MRRISLALALLGAVAAAGCAPGGNSTASGEKRGVPGSTFTVTVGTSANPVTGGYVESYLGGAKDGSISCGQGLATQKCQADFPLGTTGLELRATVAGTSTVWMFAGDCTGMGVCALSGDADKDVLVHFAATPEGLGGHPNWSAGHPMDTAAISGWDCAQCHGQNLQGLGLAPACSTCHAAGGSAPTLAIGTHTQENCAMCHSTAAADHQGLYNSFADGINPATSQFAANIVSVVTSPGTTAGTFKSTVTLTLAKGGLPYTGSASTLAQKTMYFVSYDAAAKKFPTAPYNLPFEEDPTGEEGGQAVSSVNFSYGSLTLKDASTGTYTMVKDNLPADPLAAPNAFVYGYFGDRKLNIPANTNGSRHYALLDNMISVAKVLNGTIDYTSTANVSACEKCHGAPYSKHGYRQASVAGLNDFVACKACHTDFRRGTDGGWYLLVNDIAYAASGAELTLEQKIQYAYTANVMQDTHNSHAFEFAYPQSMANCATCHEGKLDRVLTDANFNGIVCKSCHATTATADLEGRAPSFAGELLGAALSHHTFNWANGTVISGGVEKACTACHADNIADDGTVIDPSDPLATDGVGPTMYGIVVPLFKDLHSGYNKQIYAANGTRYSDTITTSVDSASFDSGTNVLTVNFSVNGANSGAVITPTVVISLYGYDTKDFIVSGHANAADGKRNLEVAFGGTHPRVAIVQGAASNQFVATANLTTWAARLADGTIKRAEVGVLPALGIDQSVKVDAATNPYIAIGGASATFDLVGNAVMADADVYGKAIVDTAKCNKCHDALAVGFHNPNYGGSGVVGCRLCHAGTSGSSHLEMQSRSIDSFVHAVHSFQPFDIGDIDFADPVAALEYTEHIDSEYPNFTTLNCESCHNAGTYGVPDESRSLPGLLSASEALTGKTRTINNVSAVVTGPAARACGSCHRSKMINEDDAAALGAFDAHTASWGYRNLPGNTTTLDSTIQLLKDAGVYGP